MDYFKIFNLNREPFSNSPEPAFFYPSAQHLFCLQQLELAIRLRRGLNVVMGNVGTGKTTLCRELILRFTETEDDRGEIETHLLLDPSFSTSREFLSMIALTFGLAVEEEESDWQIKEGIKGYLFRKGVDEKKTIVLIIDEGQKIPVFCREILREFLNYETNENKLLQIVIFAQKEFREILKEHVNFADRVNQYYFLEPLSFRETRAMIHFRLAQAGLSKDARLFTIFGLWAIYRSTGGYPRRIITLCHQILLALIIRNKIRAGWFLVRSVSGRLKPKNQRRRQWATAGLAAFLFMVFIACWFLETPLTIVRYPSLTPVVRSTSEQLKDNPDVKQPGQAKGGPLATNPVVMAKQLAVPMPATQGLAAKTAPYPEVPRNLGRMNIRSGDTIIQLFRDIYGITDADRFRAVGMANPHIDNINRVRAGERIVFPAVPVATNWPRDGKLVRIAYRQTLEEAYGLNKKNPDYLRMLPMWNSREGLVFVMVLKKFYNSESEARRDMGNLPPALAVTAEIMENPGADTVFFCQLPRRL